jgi:pilus assembly protein Flp/PilA
MLNYVLCYLNSLRDDESGQGMVEYALIIVLIAIVVITALTLAGTSIEAIFTAIAGHLAL